MEMIILYISIFIVIVFGIIFYYLNQQTKIVYENTFKQNEKIKEELKLAEEKAQNANLAKVKALTEIENAEKVQKLSEKELEEAKMQLKEAQNDTQKKMAELSMTEATKQKLESNIKTLEAERELNKAKQLELDANILKLQTEINIQKKSLESCNQNINAAQNDTQKKIVELSAIEGIKQKLESNIKTLEAERELNKAKQLELNANILKLQADINIQKKSLDDCNNSNIVNKRYLMFPNMNYKENLFIKEKIKGNVLECANKCDELLEVRLDSENFSLGCIGFVMNEENKECRIIRPDLNDFINATSHRDKNRFHPSDIPQIALKAGSGLEYDTNNNIYLNNTMLKIIPKRYNMLPSTDFINQGEIIRINNSNPFNCAVKCDLDADCIGLSYRGDECILRNKKISTPSLIDRGHFIYKKEYASSIPSLPKNRYSNDINKLREVNDFKNVIPLHPGYI